jgi:cytochrome c oxidase assembly protein subunit 15
MVDQTSAAPPRVGFAGASASAWPRRLAWATWLATIPLVLFGGSVTSLNAGLAIDGWWIVDPGKGDFFLPLYPLDRWTTSLGAFVEHTHRLIAMAVGLLAIATAVVAQLREPRKTPRVIAWLAVAAIGIQGLLGGLRVLEKSTDLAVLHGALGQAVFALVGATAIAFAPRAPRRAIEALRSADRRLCIVAVLAVLVVYAQIVIGAWLRHGQSLAALAVHVMMVLAVSGAIAWLASSLRSVAREAADARALRRLSVVVWSVLAAQLVLGLLAFVWVYVVVGRERDATELHQSFFPTLHVLGGAGLLFAVVAAAMHAFARPAPRTDVPAARVAAPRPAEAGSSGSGAPEGLGPAEGALR